MKSWELSPLPRLSLTWYSPPVPMVTWRQSIVLDEGDWKPRERWRVRFDVFILHKRRWQPLDVSTHNAPGQLPASSHFTFPSLSCIVTFQKKASDIPNNEKASAVSPRSRPGSDPPSSLKTCFVVFVCFFFLFSWNMKLVSCFERLMCLTKVHCRRLDPVSEMSLWYVHKWSRTVVPVPYEVLPDGYVDGKHVEPLFCCRNQRIHLSPNLIGGHRENLRGCKMILIEVESRKGIFLPH